MPFRLFVSDPVFSRLHHTYWIKLPIASVSSLVDCLPTAHSLWSGRQGCP